MRDQGHGPLADWVREHVQALHAPPRRLEQLVTCGNTNGLDIALRCLLSRGDCVLTEEYTYAATLQARSWLAPCGINVQPVDSRSHHRRCAPWA
jgi:aromatic amino acid aminotransferase I